MKRPDLIEAAKHLDYDDEGRLLMPARRAAIVVIVDLDTGDAGWATTLDSEQAMGFMRDIVASRVN